MKLEFKVCGAEGFTFIFSDCPFCRKLEQNSRLYCCLNFWKRNSIMLLVFWSVYILENSKNKLARSRSFFRVKCWISIWSVLLAVTGETTSSLVSHFFLVSSRNWCSWPDISLRFRNLILRVVRRLSEEWVGEKYINKIISQSTNETKL